MMISLTSLAKNLREDLGKNYHLRIQYPFVVPKQNQLSLERADAVIFSSPIPSIQTATVGFTSVEDSDGDLDSRLSNYAYLGAPILVTTTREYISTYEFRGTPIPEKVDEQPLSSSYSPVWLRERLFNRVDSPQLALSFGATKDLLIQDTRAALSHNVKVLMEIIHEEKDLDEIRSFEIAISVLRQLSMGQADHINLPTQLRTYARTLSGRLSASLSLANIPPESVAELYETFAVGDHSRRRSGVVYTPSWLARFVVSRLPTSAFQSGKAVDPTCGSGTFLVCFLERFVEERIKSGKTITANALRGAVNGLDKDSVAIEASRLSLDFFCHALKIDPPQWVLIKDDATTAEISGEWVIGNLPFGHRTHEGKQDLSAVILENIERKNRVAQGMSIILPDSLAYTKGAAKVRSFLRSKYQIQEVTRLPEATFETSAVSTMALVARRGTSPREVLVREVSTQDLRSFRIGSYVSKTYVSRLPTELSDPWRFSPFNNEFERAEKNAVLLQELADVRMGLQIYGTEEQALLPTFVKGAKPLMTDPDVFLVRSDIDVRSLRCFSAEKDNVRRAGPWELFDRPKVIVRTTTHPSRYDRLAAIPDTQGIWFTDKFAGIWIKDELISPNAIAAYLQTRFARVWFDTNNPSRKLRIKTLLELPVPKLTREWWDRAKRLARSNRVIRPNPIESEASFFSIRTTEEWSWFDSVVEAALGFEPTVGVSFEQWLSSNQRSRG